MTNELNEQTIKKREKQKRKRRNLFIRRTIFVFFFCFMCWTAWQGFLLFQKHYSIRTDYVHGGLLEDTVEGSFFIERYETVFEKDSGEKAVPLADEGERVAAGTKVAVIKSASEDRMITAPHAGRVYYTYPEWQGLLVYGEFPADPAAFVKTEEEETAGEAAAEPAVKITDPLKPLYFYTVFDEDPGLEESDSMFFRISSSGGIFRGTAVGKRTDGARVEILIRSGNGNREIPGTVEGAIRIIKDSVRGIIVPLEALTVSDDGAVGVYTVNKGLASFAEVEIAGKNSENAAVSGIPAYTEVVITPGNVSEGRKIY